MVCLSRTQLTSVRPSLPPIKFMDSEKFRREEHDYQSRHIDTPVATLPPPSRSISTYPTGPPPPYSAALQSKNLTPTAPINTQSQEILAGRGEDRQPSANPVKASLPSLLEALGVERRTGYNTESKIPTAPQTAPSTTNTHSPPTPRRAHNEPSPPGRSQAFIPTDRYPARVEPSHPQPAVRELYDPRRHDWSDRPHAPYRQASPPTSNSQPSRPPYSATDSVHSFDTAPQGPSGRSSHFSYGYAAPPVSYAAPPPAPPASSVPYPSARSEWRPSAPPSASHPGPSSGPYSESVKRHLDLYDFEMGLNEVCFFSHRNAIIS